VAHQPLPPGLYIVATPIGNLGDITVRAADVLGRCDAVACEDTRVTGKLMKHLGFSRPLWRYDDHSGGEDRARLLEAMRTRAVALVSDAGTPLISDPGYRLVREARAAGIAVTALPGACAAIAALTIAGLPTDRFIFAGFLPAKEQAREQALRKLAATPITTILYETAPRLLKSLAAIETVLPGREVAVARELTKLHEECRTGTPGELRDHFAAHPPKGEIVLLIGPADDSEMTPTNVDERLAEALQSLKPSQAAALVAKATGIDRKELYARALALKG
jgi:16S rRNA (cytidine1402-2'-O)-methyltransferase